MNKLEIIITEKAQNDIIQIKKFIAENNKNASKDYQNFQEIMRYYFYRS